MKPVNKRKKKYNPLKIVNMLKTKVHHLEMTFCVDEVNKSIDNWREENDMQDGEETPKHVVYDVYHGDLIIALKNLLIPLEQEWCFGVDSHFYNAETEDVLTIPMQWQMPKISFEDFRFGTGKLKIDRGSGIKTRWKGINAELNAILENEAPEGYERIRSDAKFSVDTRFNSLADYEYFLEARNLRRKGIAI